MCGWNGGTLLPSCCRSAYPASSMPTKLRINGSDCASLISNSISPVNVLTRRFRCAILALATSIWPSTRQACISAGVVPESSNTQQASGASNNSRVMAHTLLVSGHLYDTQNRYKKSILATGAQRPTYEALKETWVNGGSVVVSTSSLLNTHSHAEMV